MNYERKEPVNLPISEKGFTFVGKFRYKGKIAHTDVNINEH